MSDFSGIHGIIQTLDSRFFTSVTEVLRSKNIYHLQSRQFYLINTIKQKLNLQLPYYALVRHGKSAFYSNLKLLKIPDQNFCLKPIKRSLQRIDSPAALDLSLMPLFYRLDLRNINPQVLILTIDSDLELVFTQQPLPEPRADFTSVLALEIYLKLLSLELNEQDLSYVRQAEQLLRQYIEPCPRSRAYYGFAASFPAAEIAQKIQAYLLIHDYFVPRLEQTLYFTFPPLSTPDQFLNTLAKALEKVR